MKFLSLILKSARRSKRRTVLTIMSVALAVFLFAALRAVLDGFNAATAGSSSTRIARIRGGSDVVAGTDRMVENQLEFFENVERLRFENRLPFGSH